MLTQSRRMQVGKRYHRPGTAPGTLVPLDSGTSSPVRIRIIDYGPDHFDEKELATIEEVFPYRDKSTVTWINIDGLSDVPLLEKLGKHFGFHPLTLEDVLNCGQRPKIEDYGDYHFLVLKSLDRQEGGELELEQISFFLSGGYIITLQEVAGDSFEAVRERIRQNKGQIRKMGPDYLLYALIDALVDEFFPVLETYGERIEELEDEVVLHPEPGCSTRSTASSASSCCCAAPPGPSARSSTACSAKRRISSPPRPGSSCATAMITPSR